MLIDVVNISNNFFWPIRSNRFVWAYHLRFCEQQTIGEIGLHGKDILLNWNSRKRFRRIEELLLFEGSAKLIDTVLFHDFIRTLAKMMYLLCHGDIPYWYGTI